MRFIATLTLAICLALGTTRGPALAAVVISSGHVDAIALRIEEGVLRISVQDDRTSPATLHDPSEVMFVVGSAARVPLPDDPAFGFLGAAGSSLWVLPQSQNAALVWPGWNANAIAGGTVSGNSLSWRLVSVAGPGSFALFTSNQFGKPVVIFNSADGLPDSSTIAAGSHSHANWSFSSPGSYALNFSVSGTLSSGQPISANATLRFSVEGTAAPAPAPATATPPPPPSAPTMPPPAAAPQVVPTPSPSSSTPVGPPPAVEPGSAQAQEPTPAPPETPVPPTASPTSISPTAVATATSTPAAPLAGEASDGEGTTLVPVLAGAGVLAALAAAFAFFRIQRSRS